MHPATVFSSPYAWIVWSFNYSCSHRSPFILLFLHPSCIQTSRRIRPISCFYTWLGYSHYVQNKNCQNFYYVFLFFRNRYRPNSTGCYGISVCLKDVKREGWTGIRGCMDSWNLLTVVSLLAYTDPNKPFKLYTDAYDIACGAALVQNVHCTPVSTAVRWMMKILNRRH